MGKMGFNYEKFYIIKELKEFINLITEENFITFIGGIGFDPRCLESIRELKKLNNVKYNLVVLSKESYLDEFTQSNFDKNYKYLKSLLNESQFSEFPLNTTIDQSEYFNQIIKLIENIEKYNLEIILLDFSSLPRDYFFILLRTIIVNLRKEIKLGIILTEYKQIHFEPNRSEYQDPETLSGFSNIPFTNPIDKPEDISIWLPILGNETEPLEKIITMNGPFEYIFPLIPFPCINPQDCDEILIKNKYFFEKKTFNIDNIIRIPFANPFEVTKIINELVNDLRDMYKNQKTNLQFYISPYGSKLQNIGACLSAIESNLLVLYSKPSGYELKEEQEKFEDQLTESKIYLIR